MFQHNGGGTVAVKNFYATNIGKLYRSCGNCGTQKARASTFTNVKVEGAKVVAGVNANYGDSTLIKDSCVKDSSLCWIYKGTTDNDKEPTKIGSGPSGTACATSAVKTSGC